MFCKGGLLEKAIETKANQFTLISFNYVKTNMWWDNMFLILGIFLNVFQEVEWQTATELHLIHNKIWTNWGF